MEEEKITEILNEGGKVIDTIVREKDKVTTTREVELANGKSTSSTITTTKDSINAQIQ